MIRVVAADRLRGDGVEDPRVDPLGLPLRTVVSDTSLPHSRYDFSREAAGLDIDSGLTLPRVLAEAGMLDVGNDVRGFRYARRSVQPMAQHVDHLSAERPRRSVRWRRSSVPGHGQRARLWSTGWLVVSAWGIRPS